MGLKRPKPPRCGPLASKGMASEKARPARISRAACWMCAGVMKFSVPSSSSGPHRPQLLKRSASVRTSSTETVLLAMVQHLTPASTNSQRVHRRTDAALDGQGRRGKEEGVTPTLRAGGGQLLQIKDLANGQAHIGDDHVVPGLIHLYRLVGPHFGTPGIRRHRSHAGAVEPLSRLECQPWRVATGVVPPPIRLQPPSLPGRV